MYLAVRHIVIYLALAILPSRGHGPPHTHGFDPHTQPEMLSASTARWVGISDESKNWDEHPRIPRRIFQPPGSHSKPPRHRRYRKWPQPQAGLSVEPRAFEVDTLPSTPQLNAIMDRAMGKVKSMVNELEDEKGSHMKPLPKKATRNVTMAALLIEEVTRQLAKDFSMGRTEVTARLETVPIEDTMLSEMCPDAEAAFCFPQKYRTPNGECNNVKNPMWGVTGAAYLRLKEPEYEDGVGTPRLMSVIPGHVLPDALAVSSQLMWTHNHPHEHLTSLAAIWGQLVAHDISYTLPLSGYERCCDSMFRKENAMECYPIVANGNEAICQEYVRSAIGLKPGCSLGPRDRKSVV